MQINELPHASIKCCNNDVGYNDDNGNDVCNDCNVNDDGGGGDVMYCIADDGREAYNRRRGHKPC